MVLLENGVAGKEVNKSNRIFRHVFPICRSTKKSEFTSHEFIYVKIHFACISCATFIGAGVNFEPQKSNKNPNLIHYGLNRWCQKEHSTQWVFFNWIQRHTFFIPLSNGFCHTIDTCQYKIRTASAIYSFRCNSVVQQALTEKLVIV